MTDMDKIRELGKRLVREATSANAPEIHVVHRKIRGIVSELLEDASISECTDAALILWDAAAEARKIREVK